MAAAGSVWALPTLWLGGLTALGVTLLALPPPHRRWTATGITVCAFAAWVVLTNLWATPSYSSAATYHAAFLAGGFLLGRRAGGEAAPSVFGVALAFATCLSLWALWQKIGGEPRSHALFETPATLAACLNLVLLPGLVILLMRRFHWGIMCMLALISAGLLAAASRGGWLALLAGAIVAAVLLFRHRAHIRMGGYGRIAAALAAGILVFSLAVGLGHWGGEGGPSADAPTTTDPLETQSSHARIALYRRAFQSLSTSSPLLGSGYLAFYYLVEAADPAVRDYTATPIYFVHNDYLQTLLELGIPGLTGILLLVFLPVARAWRTDDVGSASRCTVIAVAAGASTMAFHALFDFPFYLPVCLLMYGVLLGLLDAIGMDARELPPSPATLLRRASVAAAATLLIWVLIKPAAAEAAVYRAVEQWRIAQAENAAYWFEVARGIEPRDWRYHWYAGQFWFTQAQGSRSATAAQRADAAFAAGVSANPRDVHNLLGRLATQRRLRDLLAAPADEKDLAAWADRATRLAPHDPAVRAAVAMLRAQPEGAAK